LDRTRVFHDPATGKIWATRIDGLNAVLTSGAPGKAKEMVKPHADDLSLRRFLEKEEGSRLRKGMVLADPHATAGAPCMLRYLGRGYTGALAIAEFEESLLVNQYDDARQGDALWRVARDGSGESFAFVGQNSLVWKLMPVPERRKVLFRADHQIRAWDPTTNGIDALTPPNKTPASFLDCQGAVAAWHEEPELVVRDLAGEKDILRLKIEPERYAGHSPQLTGALSADGALLAHCAKAGHILVHDVTSGMLRSSIQGDFEMVNKLAFTADNRRVLVKEKYGRWRLMAFELASGEPVATWPNLNDLGDGDFALDTEHDRVACFSRGLAHVYELPTMRKHGEVRIDQVAKSAALAWTHDGLLAVRTDLGCVGLYRVE